MKRLFTILLLVTGALLEVPAVAQQVVSSGGNTFTKPSVSIEFIIGETAITTFSKPNTMITQGMLQPAFAGALPVRGLEFSARRINKQEVQLDWRTLQELNNKGFTVERRKENEASFAAIAFISSMSPDGNNLLPQQYYFTDKQAFAGKIFYRLAQQDHDGRITYSDIRMVTGSEELMGLHSWSAEGSNSIQVRLTGGSKDALLLYDISGRMLRQMPVNGNETTQFSGLVKGVYIVKLQARQGMVQRVVVQ